MNFSTKPQPHFSTAFFHRMKIIFFSLATFAVAATSRATIQLNEIFINPPGTDNGQEFIEFLSTTGGVESLAGLTLIGVEGDGSTPGPIDFILNLGAFSTGTNGLFLWRDSAAVINPAPAPATTLNVADFAPDIENGSQTFLLVAGFTGLLAQDLDTNNDGTLDVLPWTSVIDAIGGIENDGPLNVGYADELGFPNIGPGTFTSDAVFRDGTTGQWQGTDVVGVNPGGPYTADPNAGQATFPATGTELVSPGNGNASVVPEPGCTALLATSGLLALARRRRV